MPDRSPRVYEQPALREALGDVLRPGGLALTDEALASCALTPGARVLDVGCSAGSTVTHLRDQHDLAAIGLDASDVLLGSARATRPGLPLLLGRGERLPICDSALDAIVAECSLSLMADTRAALVEFRRTLKPGGRLLLADLYLRNGDGRPPCGEHPPVSCLGGALTRMQVTGMLAELGFALHGWQDRSQALKVLAARLILAGIPPAQLWTGACAGRNITGDALKPGYFWLVASKGGVD